MCYNSVYEVLIMILITGGTGYIGSHTVCELLKLGKEVLIIDNLYNSKIEVLGNIEKITGKTPKFILGDLCNADIVNKIFEENEIESVIHFAGLKAVGESVSMPLYYYENNIYGTLNLLNAMKKHNVKKLVFSSSATVYGMTNKAPFKEDMPTSATNPYGRTKLFIEHILNDLYVSDDSWNIVILRYFNPVGADESGLIGENPNGMPNNIMPIISKTAAGEIERMFVFGDDYNTADGSCIRDFIHITDLAMGHVKALELLENGKCEVNTINLGTGNGYSVFELIKAFEKASGRKIQYSVGPRRTGDVPITFADATLAKEKLGWSAKYGIEKICEDAWRWQKNCSNIK